MTVTWKTSGNQTHGSCEVTGGVKIHAIICENRMLADPFSAVMFRIDRGRVKTIGTFPRLSDAIEACERALKRSSDALEEVA